MARSKANLKFSIFDGLRGLSREAKLLYIRLLVEPTMTQAGVGALRERRWARDTEMTLAEVEKALRELDEKGYALYDEDTEEFLVRTLIRNDGIAEEPNVLWAALRAAVAVESPRLRKVLASELRKLPPKPADKIRDGKVVYRYPDPHAVADQLDPDTATPDPGPGAGVDTPAVPAVTSGNPSGNLSGNLSGNISGNVSDRTDPGYIPGTHGGTTGGGGGGYLSERSCLSNHSPDNSLLFNVTGVTLNESESSDKPQTTTRKRRRNTTPTPPGFDDFWATYPRRTAKQNAIKAYTKALKAGVPPQRIVDAAKRYAAAAAAAGSDPRYIPHPATWLNGGRYDDPEPDVPQPTTPVVLQAVAGGRVGHVNGHRIPTTTARVAAVQALKRGGDHL